MEVDNQGLEDLFAEAEALVDLFHYEEAIACYKTILSQDSKNVKALEECAGVMLETGEAENSCDYLKKCIKLKPDEGYTKYLMLAQLQNGSDALQSFLKGLDILHKDSHSKDCRRDISNIHVSISELYTTDLCDEPDAEQQCLYHIDSAIKADDSNPDVYRAAASYNLIKGDKELAKTNISKSLNLWLPAYEAIRSNSPNAQSDDHLEVCPSYDNRIDCVKILIETDMWDEAKKVCDGLLDEDDENIEVWYLLGWSNYLMGKEYYGNTRFYMNKVLELHKKLKTNDEDIVDHASNLLEEVGPGDSDDECSDNNGELSLESSDEEEMNVS